MNLNHIISQYPIVLFNNKNRVIQYECLTKTTDPDTVLRVRESDSMENLTHPVMVKFLPDSNINIHLKINDTSNNGRDLHVSVSKAEKSTPTLPRSDFDFLTLNFKNLGVDLDVNFKIKKHSDNELIITKENSVLMKKIKTKTSGFIKEKENRFPISITKIAKINEHSALINYKKVTHDNQ